METVDKLFNNLFPDDPPPKFPLHDKWYSNYPLPGKMCSGLGYGCMFCGNCPYGDNWKCPEEDKEVYDEYMKVRKEWEERNPNWLEVIMNQEIVLEDWGYKNERRHN